MKPGEERDRMAGEWIGRTREWARRRGARWAAAADDLEAEAYYQLALALDYYDPSRGAWEPVWHNAMARALTEVVQDHKPRGYRTKRDEPGPRVMEYGNPEVPPGDLARDDAALARVDALDAVEYLTSDLSPRERVVVMVGGGDGPGNARERSWNEVRARLGCCPQSAIRWYRAAMKRMKMRAEFMQQENAA